MVGQVGDRALGVGEAEVLQRTSEETEGLQEEKLVGGRFSIKVETTQTRRAYVGEVVVLACVAVRSVPLLEVVHNGIIVLGIDDGTQARLQYPLKLPDGNILLVFELRSVAPPCSAIACTIYIGTALGSHGVCVAVIIESRIAPVLVDTMNLRKKMGQGAGDKEQEQQYVEPSVHNIRKYAG